MTNRHLPDTDIRAAIENDVYGLWMTVARSTGNTAIATDEIAWVKTAGSDWPNRIFRARFTPTDADATVSAIVEQIIAGNMPPVWTVGATSTPENLSELLLQHGFCKHMEQTGMAMEMSSWDGSVSANRDPQLAMAAVGDLDTLRQWTLVSDTCFGRHVDPGLMSQLLGRSDMVLYAGTMQDKVVATLLIHYADDVAGLHTVTTLPACRKRGIAAAMVNDALGAIRERGYPLVVLQSSPPGEGVYRRIGFKAYSTLVHYRLASTPAKD